MPSAFSSVSAKPTVGLIGAGAVGRALAHALCSAGFTITAIVDRRAAAAKKLAAEIGQGRCGSDLKLIGRDTQLLLLAVPDEQIAQVDRSLKKHLPTLGLSVIAHTSGALPGAEMKNAHESGIAVGSMHPLQTFPQGGEIPTLRGVYGAIEGSPVAEEMLASVTEAMGGIPIIIPTQSKAAYHAGAVFAANFLPVLVQAATELLADAQIAPLESREMLKPLMRLALENCLRSGPAKALTGPVARGDAQTIAKHIEILELNHPGLAGLYRMLSLKAVELALEQSLPDESLEKIQKILTT